MEGQIRVLLGVKVKPGPIERHIIENFGIDNTINLLKNEAEKKLNIPSTSLEFIFRGKILKDTATLQSSGVKNGEMVHVVNKKVQLAPTPAPTFSDAELQQITSSLRTLGCTPNAPGWTRAMQLLNDESAMSEILEHAPSLNDDCVTLSILHEVELLAALGANVQTMRRGADARPDLPTALRHLLRLVHSRSNTAVTSDNVPTSGFAYSLEALSEDEDAEEEESEESERSTITQEQLAAALQTVTEAVQSRRSGAGGQENLLRLLAGDSRTNNSALQGPSSGSGGSRPLITPEMFNSAITEAMSRSARPDGTPMEQSATASTSDSPTAPGAQDDYATQLQRMREMGLLDDELNVRALLICRGDVNAAINLVFSGAISDE